MDIGETRAGILYPLGRPIDLIRRISLKSSSVEIEVMKFARRDLRIPTVVKFARRACWGAWGVGG